MSDQQQGTASSWWRRLGAGFVTGAADDDPSGVATYSQVGARFGFSLLWVVFLTVPLMIAIQMVSARIGRVTGRGLADNLMKTFPKPAVWALIALLIIANTINIGADLAAMGAGMKLLVGGSSLLYALVFAALSTALQVFLSFDRYAPVLKVMALTLFTYVATVFVIHVPWESALKAIAMPALQWHASYLTAIVAVLGTTISPYLFCWQAAQEVEEVRQIKERKPLRHARYQGEDALRRIAMDTSVGMVFSNVIAFFMILTTAAVLHTHGKTDIQSASDAAQALKPLAGPLAFALFAAGIVSTGLLAVPVLAGSTAFAVAGAAHAPYGLNLRLSNAKVFYAVLVGSMVVGAALTASPIDPMKALYWSAVVNGVCAVPLMAAMMWVARQRTTMGKFMVGGHLWFWGWAATLVMGAAAVIMFATLGHG